MRNYAKGEQYANTVNNGHKALGQGYDIVADVNGGRLIFGPLDDLKEGSGGLSNTATDIYREIKDKIDQFWNDEDSISPSNDDQGISLGVVFAVTRRDPHLITFDGLGYGFQAVGEFTLVRGDGFEIQVRQEAAGANVSLNSAVVMAWVTIRSVSTRARASRC